MVSLELVAFLVNFVCLSFFVFSHQRHLHQILLHRHLHRRRFLVIYPAAPIKLLAQIVGNLRPFQPFLLALAIVVSRKLDFYDRDCFLKKVLRDNFHYLAFCFSYHLDYVSWKSVAEDQAQEEH